jgi:hypothetical protein
VSRHRESVLAAVFRFRSVCGEWPRPHQLYNALPDRLPMAIDERLAALEREGYITRKYGRLVATSGMEAS